jgi:DNA-binding NarL/FixJ family response regulator
MMKIAVVDDHPITIYGMKLMLSLDKESNIKLINTYQTGSEAIDKVINDKPDLLLVDIQLPDMSGFDLITYLKSTNIELKYAVYTSFYNREIILKTIKSNVNGIMSKATKPEQLIANIQKIVTSDDFVNSGDAIPEFIEKKKEALVNPNIRNRLTNREREILDLIIESLRNKEIADLLNISISTVEFHRKNIYSKFEVNSLAALLKKIYPLS